MDRLRLLTPAQVPIAHAKIFRVSVMAVATMTMVLGAIVAACIWIGWHGGVAFGQRDGIPGVIAWWAAFWLGLFWLFYANDLRKAVKPGAWLAIADEDGVYLRYRSYQNIAWGEGDVQVVFVPYPSIASARINRRWWHTPENQYSGRTRSERRTYIELELRDVELHELGQRLADERAGKPGRTPKGTKIWGHFPVSVEPGNILRIEWRARPGAAVFAEWLESHAVSVRAAAATTTDLTRVPDEEQIRELARRGTVIDLIRVLRHNNAMTLAQAKDEAKRLIAEANAATAEK